jgi:phosphodiesterase/alkaline phosphatase D-like protein
MREYQAERATERAEHKARSQGAIEILDRYARRVFVCSSVLALLSLAIATGAWAATGHGLVSSLSEAPAGSELASPRAVAVNHSSGRVFVGDSASGYVDVFGASGEYVTRFGDGAIDPVAVAADEASSRIYVADPFSEAILIYAPDGKGAYGLVGQWFGEATPGRGFGQLAGVAVDNSEGPSAGFVYVAEARSPDVSTGTVDVFKPKLRPGEEGEFLRRLTSGKPEAPNGVAVSASSGRVLVADSVKGAVLAYSPSGALEEKLTGKGSPYGSFKGKGEELDNVAGVAVDPTSEDIYVAEARRHAVSQYSSSGVWQGWITAGQNGDLSEPRAVALADAAGVLVADAGARLVDVYGPEAVVPDVETGKVAKSALKRTTAVLAGTVNGDGKAASYRFEYGESESLGSETPTQGSGSAEASVTAEVSGLHAGRTYFFRIVGENESGANVGAIHEFTTPPAVEGVSTGSATSIEPTAATLNGQLLPGEFDAHYYFEWGTSSAYGNSTPAPPGTDAGSGTSAVAAEASLAGLSPNTLYHYRIVVQNSFGATYGEDRTFTSSGPPQIVSEATTGISQTAATIHAKVNPDQIAATYHFEYGETTAYGTELPLGGEALGSGSAPVAVSAALTELKVGATYHYRVVASNTAGTTTGADQTFMTVAPAPVDATYSSGVSDDQAALNARINPLGNDTHAYFQYGTQSCQANPAVCSESPVPPGEDLGAGSEDVPLSTHLSGLAPGTTYYYRVLDSNALGITEGPEHTFTTQQLPVPVALIDSRAWEMVSPPNKEGAPVESLTREGGIIMSSEDGSRLTYVVDGPLGDEVQGNRSPEWQQILATRNASAWSSQDIATASTRAKGIAGGNAPEYQFFTPDLSTALDEPAEPGPEPPLAPGVKQATMYLRDNAASSFLPLVTEANTAPGTQFGGHIRFVSATHDLSHVVITSNVALAGPGSSHGLYEWSGGQLRYVSVLPNGIPPAGEVELGFRGRVLARAISDDGSRVFWGAKAENSGRGRLYMRDVTRAQTVRIDAAKGVVEPEESSAQFQTASSDGSRVFFTDKQRLTADSTAEPGNAPGRPDLYECDITEVAGKPTCSLKDLTVDHNPGEHAAVQNFIFGAAEDGASVYVVAQGVLSANANGNGDTAHAGQNNLYELHDDGSQWTTTYIATLSAEDSPEWEGNAKANTSYLTARASPNGRYLAFMSAAPITGYDNVDASPEANGARDEEVFLYDSANTALRCISCNPSGARPAGVFDTAESGEGLGLLVDRRKVWAESGHEHWLAGNIPGWTAQSVENALFQSRYLSDQGRLYFNSPDSLVPAARNGKENVYEYEPAGVGSCQSPSGGCISLISGAGSDRESAFIEATPDGSSVFFVTEANLLPQDTDTAFDIYDARECTEASPCLTPPAPAPPSCAEAATCRPAEPAQTIPGGPSGTAAFSGPGNAESHASPPAQETKANKTSKPLTNSEKLSKALKACRKRYAHAKRVRKKCESTARKRYGKGQKAKAKAESKHKVTPKAKGSLGHSSAGGRS